MYRCGGAACTLIRGGNYRWLRLKPIHWVKSSAQWYVFQRMNSWCQLWQVGKVWWEWYVFQRMKIVQNCLLNEWILELFPFSYWTFYFHFLFAIISIFWLNFYHFQLLNGVFFHFFSLSVICLFFYILWVLILFASSHKSEFFRCFCHFLQHKRL